MEKPFLKMLKYGHHCKFHASTDFVNGNHKDRLRKKQLIDNGVIYFNSVDSTNLAAKRFAAKSTTGYSVIIAEKQKQGRGRSGRSWHSPAGKGLWFSVLLRPEELPQNDAAPITLATAAVLAKELNRICCLPVKIKWPNDLILNNKKIGGILTEIKNTDHCIEYLVVGIGLNVNQQPKDFLSELRPLASSLAIEANHRFDRTELFLVIINQLKEAYTLFIEQGFSPFYALWKDYNITLGKKICIHQSGAALEGIAVDLTKDGSLMVEDRYGKNHTIKSGEIQ